MKNKKREGKIGKGAPSGFVASLLFHVGIFFIAGLFVVFTVVNRPEPEFQPPPAIERPKMKLKKPKVKVKKSSNPRPSSRIVAKVKTREMPDIQLPDLEGVGDGLLGGSGFGEFMDLPEVEQITVLGSENSIGSDLVGTFYDFKRNSAGKFTGLSEDDRFFRPIFLGEANEFIRSGFSPSSLRQYYRSDRKLYASCLVVSPIWTSIGPSAFDTPDSGGGFWMVHYKGKLVHKDGITFRFVCQSDYFTVISVDNEIVWAGVWNTPDRFTEFSYLVGGMYKPRFETRRRFIGNDRIMAGEWITLEPGEAKDIDIIIGDENGQCGWIIAVEEEGVEYEEDQYGEPIYPIFRTAELSHDMLDQIYKDLPEDEVNCTNGPVFNDLGITKTAKANGPSGPQPDEKVDALELREMRTWNFTGDRTLEAEFVRVLFDKLVLKDVNGEEHTIPRENFVLSEADEEYLELENPPELDLLFRKSIERKNFAMIRGAENRPPEQRANFGAKVVQKGSGDYNHPLTVEFFAIGQEIKGDKYILLDRKRKSFIPSRENDRMLEFYSSRIVRMTDLWDDSLNYSRRGEQYYGFIITVRDKRGKLIAVDASNDWLEEHLGKLEKLKIRNYMDKTCSRTFPSRPKSYIASRAAGRQ
jgi:hypothetical protein